MMQKVIIALTVLLVLSGAGLFFFGSSDEVIEFADRDSYEAYRVGDGAGLTAPALPACASTIVVAVADEAIESLAFSCGDVASRSTFIKDVESQFDWNVALFGTDRILLSRVIKKDL